MPITERLAVMFAARPWLIFPLSAAFFLVLLAAGF